MRATFTAISHVKVGSLSAKWFWSVQVILLTSVKLLLMSSNPFLRVTIEIAFASYLYKINTVGETI